MTVITYSNKTLLPFTEFKKGSENNYYSYKIDGVDANSLSLEYNLLPNPLVVSVGQQLQIWFWQDLVNFTEENNFGKMLQKMERFIFFALFTCLDCVSANNQCEANSMGDDCRVIKFKEGTKNKILTNHVIRTDQVQDRDICELRCYLEPNCVSYNYGPGGGGTSTCELNDMTHLQVFDSFEDKSGFLYTEIFNPCDSNPCANQATCQAGFGDHGYRCLCPAGYQGVQCETDIDECNDFNPLCDENAHCGNTDGSFTCTCKAGYAGNGHLCTANSECQDNNNLLCDVNADCKKRHGSYKCTCKKGYTENGDSCTGLMCWLCFSLWTLTFLIHVMKLSGLEV
ncbi:neurogenic locus notch homolog protein 1-like [Stylophora pistillata]|uniref:neurogenic locus notch homolog protein 1-like n=1 Tax=Stylophora pistillata TaxID=50429 RepID=UPI000C04707B|nr:neurogenic locus notch homolog protein 1-like [Stylophora pistillata]